MAAASAPRRAAARGIVGRGSFTALVGAWRTGRPRWRMPQAATTTRTRTRPQTAPRLRSPEALPALRVRAGTGRTRAKRWARSPPAAVISSAAGRRSRRRTRRRAARRASCWRRQPTLALPVTVATARRRHRATRLCFAIRRQRDHWFEMVSTLLEDSAPVACTEHPEAWGAPAHPGAPPQQLGGSAWSEQLASACRPPRRARLFFLLLSHH